MQAFSSTWNALGILPSPQPPEQKSVGLL